MTRKRVWPVFLYMWPFENPDSRIHLTEVWSIDLCHILFNFSVQYLEFPGGELIIQLGVYFIPSLFQNCMPWCKFIAQIYVYLSSLHHGAGACLYDCVRVCMCVCVCVSYDWLQIDFSFWQPLLDCTQIKMASTLQLWVHLCVHGCTYMHVCAVWWMPQIMAIGLHCGEPAQPSHITLTYTHTHTRAHTLSWMDEWKLKWYRLIAMWCG